MEKYGVISDTTTVPEQPEDGEKLASVDLEACVQKRLDEVVVSELRKRDQPGN